MDELIGIQVHAEARVERGTATHCACGGRLSQKKVTREPGSVHLIPGHPIMPACTGDDCPVCDWKEQHDTGWRCLSCGREYA